MDRVDRALSPAEIAAHERRGAAFGVTGLSPAAPVTFVAGSAARELVVPLDFPVEYNGQIIETVTIRRPVMREWRAYLRACADAAKQFGPGAEDTVDQVWLSVPAAVLEELDMVDAARVEGTMEGFFGRSGSPDETADDTTSSSTTGEESPST